jgi:MFS transporter, FHS family, glucose/mannose:H+ symporter
MTSWGEFQWMVVLAGTVGGFGVAILGSIKLALSKRLAIDETRVGGLVSLFGFIMGPAILAAGFATDAIDKRWVIAVGGGVMTASMVVLAIARRYGQALLAVLLLSGGWSVLVNVTNVLTAPALQGTHSAAFAFNLLNVFFGLGALVTPLLATGLIRQAGYTAGLVVLALLILPPAAIALHVQHDSLLPAIGEIAGAGELLDNPMVWLLGIGLCFYGPLESSVAAWATTYLSDKGLSETRASGMLTLFWLTFMIGRLMAAFALPPGSESLVLTWLAAGCIVLLGTMVASGSRRLSIVAVIGTGLVFGPVFPTLIALLSQYVPVTLFGRAVGVFFAIGAIGWVLIPAAIGAYAARTSVQRGFSIATASAVGLLVIMLAIHNGWFTSVRSKQVSDADKGAVRHAVLAAPDVARSLSKPFQFWPWP